MCSNSHNILNKITELASKREELWKAMLKLEVILLKLRIRLKENLQTDLGKHNTKRSLV